MEPAITVDGKPLKEYIEEELTEQEQHAADVATD